MKKIISIIVPCYNEHETIQIYYDEAIKYLDDKYDYKIIFVNDGSKDDSLDIMKSLAKKDKRILYVSFSRNFGKEAAMYAGLESAKKLNSDAAIIMDVDLQDPPYLIPSLLKEYEDGYNLIYTRHKDRNGAKKSSTFFAKAFYKFYSFFTGDKELANGARDYCLLDRKVIDAFLLIKDDKRFTKGIYHYVGFKKKCIEFEYNKRSAGETKWGFRKLLKYAFIGIQEFSTFYLIIPKLIGIVLSILLTYDIVRQIINAVSAGSYDAFNWMPIRIDFVALLIVIVLYYLFKLLYDIRSQVRHRPIYIEDESNVGEIDETK